VLTSGFSYQWFNSAGAISGQTNSTLNVTATESYYVQVTSTQANCAPSQTSSTKITVLSLPVPTFTITPTPLCTGNELTFTNQSSVDANSTPTYAWTFGDNTTSALQNPKHTYTAAATYPIFLTVDYTGLTGCAVTTSKSFPVFAAVAPTITAATSGICAGGTNTLTVNGTFASVSWGTGSTGSPLTINQPGTYNVTTTDSNGCAGKAQLTVALAPDPTLAVSADKTSIPPGQSVQLTASGADTYAWTPIETLSNPAIANPIATPAVSTTYTVKGTLNGGCSAQKTIDIQVNSDLLTLKVTNVFTPNGDGHNDLWVIPGIEYYTDCTLTLYDKNGSRVFEEKGYKNDWDGMYKGQPAPEGTYYYVLLCTDKKPLTGSLLLAR
jgi:gliding motility-associated-like protein